MNAAALKTREERKRERCWNPRQRMRHLAPILICAVLCGCVEIEDFGPFWAQSQQDTTLIGRWQSSDGFTCEFTTLSDHEMILRETMPTNTPSQSFAAVLCPSNGLPARTLSFAGHKFLLVKRSQRGTGEMRCYSLSSNLLTFLRFRDEVLEKAILSGTVQGTIPDRIPYDPKKASVPHPLSAFQNCKISILTTNTMSFLAAKENNKYWEEMRAYAREATERPTTDPAPPP